MSMYEYQKELYLDVEELSKKDVKVRYVDFAIHVCPVSNQFYIIGMDGEYTGDTFDSYNECLDRMLAQLELIDKTTQINNRNG